MALIDRARDVYFDRARERWKHKGFDTDITDILEDYRTETNKKIKRDKVNVLSTFLTVYMIMTMIPCSWILQSL